MRRAADNRQIWLLGDGAGAYQLALSEGAAAPACMWAPDDACDMGRCWYTDCARYGVDGAMPTVAEWRQARGYPDDLDRLLAAAIAADDRAGALRLRRRLRRAGMMH